MMYAGYYRFDLFEGPVWKSGFANERELHFATAEDLADLAVLGVRPEQAAWIAAGSVCVWVADDEGAPAAMLWGHVDNHVDRHLGSWSRPTESTVYVSGVMTRADLRGQGFARTMLLAGMQALAERGIQYIRTVTVPDNEASIGFHERAGMKRVGSLRGVRLGRLSVKRITRVRP
jgi:RimJ/RimL family protein N-acetyltransferase